MGQQHRTTTKRRRRANYIKRKNELLKLNKTAPVPLAKKLVKVAAPAVDAEPVKKEVDTTPAVAKKAPAKKAPVKKAVAPKADAAEVQAETKKAPAKKAPAKKTAEPKAEA